MKQTHEYMFLSLQMNLSGKDPVETQALGEFQSLVGDGWRAIYFGPRQGFVDQHLAILEPPLNVL